MYALASGRTFSSNRSSAASRTFGACRKARISPFCIADARRSLALGEFAGNRIGMGKVIDSGFAGLEDQFVVASQADKRAFRF